MPIYRVEERQTIIATYFVEADNKNSASDLVQAYGCDEFDHHEVVKSRIVSVELWGG